MDARTGDEVRTVDCSLRPWHVTAMVTRSDGTVDRERALEMIRSGQVDHLLHLGPQIFDWYGRPRG